MATNQIKMGVILSYASIVVGNIISIIYTPMMLRLMGQKEYGLFSLANSVVGFLGLMSFGLGSVIIRYAVKFKTVNDRDSEYSLYGMSLIIYSLISVVVCIIGIYLYWNIEHFFSKSMTVSELSKLKIIISLMIGSFALSLPLSLFTSIMTVYEIYIFPRIINIFILLINPIVMLPLLSLGYKSVTMTIVTTIFSILNLLINTFYCFYILRVKIIFTKWDKKLIKEISKYTSFIFIGLIVDKIFWSTDQFILGIVSGTVAVAIYSIGFQFITYYMSFSTAISGVFLPKVTTLITNGTSNKEISNLFIRVGRIQFIIMAFILIGFTLFGKDFIVLWAGANYIKAYYIALIVMYPLTIPLIQGLGLPILQAKNKHSFRSILYFFIAILNLWGSAIMAKYWNGIGCAIASSLAFFIGHGIIMNIYYYKKVSIDLPKFWMEISSMMLPLIVSSFIGIGINIYFPSVNFWNLLIKVIIFIISYFITMWFFGMNKYEKELFMDPLRKIYIKLRVSHQG